MFLKSMMAVNFPMMNFVVCHMLIKKYHFQLPVIAGSSESADILHLPQQH